MPFRQSPVTSVRGASRQFWIFRLQLAACPADALKARQTEVFVLRHYLCKRHCPCILQTGITKCKIQHHIVISGIFILFQNSSDFFSMVLRFLIVTSIKERAASFSRPNHLLILSVTDIQPYRRTHNEHDKYDCDNGFSVHQLVLLFLLSVLIADKSENARTDNRQSCKAYP